MPKHSAMGDAGYFQEADLDRERAEEWVKRGRQFHIEFSRGDNHFFSNHFAHNVVCMAAAHSAASRYSWWWDLYTPKLQPAQKMAADQPPLTEDNWQTAIRPNPYDGTYPQVNKGLGDGGKG